MQEHNTSIRTGLALYPIMPQMINHIIFVDPSQKYADISQSHHNNETSTIVFTDSVQKEILTRVKVFYYS